MTTQPEPMGEAVPCKVTPEMVKAARPWLLYLTHMRANDRDNAIENGIKAALAVQFKAARTEGGERKAQDGAEPVAWYCEFRPGGGSAPYGHLTRKKWETKGAFSVQPLYAHPAPLQSGLPSVEEVARVKAALEFYEQNWDWYPGDGEQPNGVDPGSPPTFYEAEPNGALKDDEGKRATEALKALSLIGQAQAPEGFVLVPREPTHEMICAGDGQDPGFGTISDRIYAAMLAASPKAGGAT